MLPLTVVGTSLYLLGMAFSSAAEANFVEVDKWGQEYCRSSYCSLMDKDGWVKCCERYKKCCAYAEFVFNGFTRDPFSYEMEKPPRPATTTATTTTTSLPPTTSKETTTEDLGGPLEALPPPSTQGPGSLQPGRPANLRLPSLDQIKPVTLEGDRRSGSGYKPEKPRKNDVTYHLPPLHPDVEAMRREEHQRESCRAKFCGIMGIHQWYNCCSKYKNCCAYVTYHTYQANPFFFEKDPWEP